MANNRMERANSEVMHCLADIIDSKLQDPRFSGRFLTITDVKMAPDFKYCKVMVSTLCDNQEEIDEIMKLLKKSEGFIKGELANMVRMPAVPQLNFVVDKGSENSLRVNEILKNLKIPKE